MEAAGVDTGKVAESIPTGNRVVIKGIPTEVDAAIGSLTG